MGARLGIGSWALADQGIVSLGSFLTTLLLARELAPARFGAFALLYGVMLFLNTIHASLVVYPLTLRAPRLAPDHVRPLSSVALLLSLALAVPLEVALAGSAGLLGVPQIIPLAVLAHLAWLGQETARRTLLARLRYRDACWGDALSYLGQAAVIAALTSLGVRSLGPVFAAMAATSLLGGLSQLALLRLARPGRDELRLLLAFGLRAGRWVVAANLLGAVLLQALPWALALTRGTVASAELQAVATVLGATFPVMFGVANLITPLLAGASGQAPAGTAARLATPYVGLGLLLVLPYDAVLLIWPRAILALVYGPASVYVSLSTPLRLLVIAYLLLYLSHCGGAILYGLERVRQALLIQLAGTAALILAALPLTTLWGVSGAAAGSALIHAARLATYGAIRPRDPAALSRVAAMAQTDAGGAAYQ